MSQQNLVNDYTIVNNSTTSLFTFTEDQLYTNSNDIEKKILIALNLETPDDISFNENACSIDDISDPIMAGVMITNQLYESNSVMRLNFQTNTPVSTYLSSQELVQHSAGQPIMDTLTNEDLNLVSEGETLLPITKTNEMKLGPDTAPLYSGFLKFKFEKGDTEYTSIEGHRIILDQTDPDVNFFGCINSTSTTLNSQGIKGGFDNIFNNSTAFYTENIIYRNDKNQLYTIADDTLNNDGASKVFTISLPELEEEYTTGPAYGAFKFDQGSLQVLFDDTNNINIDSNLSIVQSSTDITEYPISVALPPTSMTEEDFIQLFNDVSVNDIQPGYSFDIIIGKDIKGGYFLDDNSTNKFNIPNYDASNQISYYNPTQMLQLDYTNITKNYAYILTLQNDLTLQNKHKLVIQNGQFIKNPASSTNKNFEDFEVCDGPERLEIKNAIDINDLESPAVIKVLPTNNTFDDEFCRYKKNNSVYNETVNRLVVNYEDNESDFLEDVGIVNTVVQENYYVNSDISVLLPNTLSSSNNGWNTEKDIAKSDDSVLVFQKNLYDNLFDKTIVKDYKALGFKNLITDQEFALMQIKLIYDFTNSYDDSRLINTSDMTDRILNSTIRFSEIDLNSIQSEDLRVVLYCKTKSDLPTITPKNNSNNWNWNTSNYEEKLQIVNNNIVDGNGEQLISSKITKNYLGKDIYKMINTNPLNNLNVEIIFSTNEEAVESIDALENISSIKLLLINYDTTLSVNEFSIFTNLYNTAIVDYEDCDTSVQNGDLSTEISLKVFKAYDSFLAAFEKLTDIDTILNSVSNNSAIKANISIVKTALGNIVTQFNGYKSNATYDTSNYTSMNNNEYITTINPLIPTIKLQLDGINVNIIDRTVKLDESDTVIYDITENTSTLNEFNVTENIKYKVIEYETIKEYFVAIKLRLGPYKNVHAVTKVTEKTIWYQLIDKNQNRIMPDYYLTQIKNSNNEQLYNSSRRFLDASDTEVFNITCETKFLVKDLMGFTVGIQYKPRNSNNWETFDLGQDSLFDNSVDLLFDLTGNYTIITPVTNPVTNDIFGTFNISIDSSIETLFGLLEHKAADSEFMYTMDLNTPEGNTSFDIKCYKYDYSNLDTLAYINTEGVWSPYNNDDNNDKFFIPNLGTELAVISSVTTVPDSDNVKLTIKNNDGDELIQMEVNKWIITNFNILLNRKDIIQHDYNISELSTQNRDREYYTTKFSSVNNSFYSKLLFGNQTEGIRVEILPHAIRGDKSSFYLTGDHIHINLLKHNIGTTTTTNTYTGLYSGVTGTEVTPTNTGFPNSTNSERHRNIFPKKFRGYKNDATEISVLRTKTTIKFCIGEDYVDNFEDSTYGQISGVVWNNINNPIKILSVTDMKSSTENGKDIGSLGLRIKSNFSMFSETSIPTNTLYDIPIQLEIADLKKTILNPVKNDTDITEGNVLLNDFSDFIPYKFVPTKILVTNTELFKITYNVPPVKIYHSHQYINDIRVLTEIEWGTPKTYSDNTLRDGIVLKNNDDNGFITIKRGDDGAVTKYTKYLICPPPIGFCEAYSIDTITQASQAPYDLSEKTPERYYVDISTIDYTTHPFNKNPVDTGFNTVNSIPNIKGLNNLNLKFSLPDILELRNNEKSDFSFNIGSNKLTIYSGIGLINEDSSYDPPTQIFNGYIDELNITTKWITELSGVIDNEFNTTDKKWYLKIKQPFALVENFINIKETLQGPSIFIDGITSFALGTYYLNLYLFDSVNVNYYSIERNYNTESNKVDVTFSKYSSPEVMSWEQNENFTKIENFMPLIDKRESFTISVSIEYVLSNDRINIDTLIKEKVVAILSSNTSQVVWVPDASFEEQSAPIRLMPLTINGSLFLHSILQVTGVNPCRIIGFNRPDIMRKMSADGGILTKITADGVLHTVKLTTNEISLKPIIKIPTGNTYDIGREFFTDNIV
jgi:hypothetical protein